MKTHAILLTYMFFVKLLSAQPNHKVVIEQLYINDVLHSLATGATLSLNANDELRIYFLKKQSTDHFCYILKGVNRHIICDTLPIASYTNLRGGDYEFLVWFDQNGVMPDTTRFKLAVRRSLVEEDWFLPSVAFYGLLLIGAVVYFWTIYNFRQKLKIQNIRNQIAADLHDEVGSTLSSISIFAKTLERRMRKNAVEGLPIVEKIRTSSDETIANLRDTVWAIDPLNDDMPKVLEKMRSFAYHVLTAKEIPLQFENGFDAMKNLKITMEQRRNVYLMFKEAIHNIIKHAEATQVVIEVVREKHSVRITIRDNGKGFDADILRGASEGNGLKNFERRAKECFIQFDLVSKIGEGTTLTFVIPEI